MKKLILGFMALSLTVLMGCTQKQAVDNSKPVIKVNDSVITQKVFDDALNAQVESSIMGAQGIDINDPKNKIIYLIFKDRVANELIIRQLLSQEIEKRNITVNEKDIDKSIEELTKKVGGEKKLKEILKTNKVSMDKFKESMRNDLKMKSLIDSFAITKVSDGEAKRFYEKNKKTKFTHQDTVRASHILISASTDDLKDKIKAENPKISKEELRQKIEKEMSKLNAKAQKILKEAKANPAKFDKLAEKYSEDFSSAKNGGDLGFFAKEEMVKPFSKVAFSLKPDTISNIVRTQFGFHIIKVTDRKTAGVVPYDEVKPEIKKYLEDQNKIQALQKFIDALKSSAKIKYLDEDYNPKNIKKELKNLAKEQKNIAPPAEGVKK